MDKIIRIRRSEYEQMQQELATLRKLPAVVEQLEAKIASLEATIALLKGGKDSRTSSTAPSHDFGRSNEISLRTPSGKKSGGQPGHRGYTHLLSDNPDEIIDHHPSVCTHCGKDLQGVNSTSFTGRQLVDIPPISPIYIEHRSHVKNCPSCGCKNCGAFPEHICAPLQYGSQVEAMVGYLSVFQTIPYKRICVLFKDFFNLHLSEGTVDNFLERLAQKANPVYETIRKKIQQSEIVGSDETGCRVNGKKYWFHVWQNNLLTFIVAFASRGYEVIGKYFPDGFIHSFYISDCWNAQLKVIAKVHQLCMAHLLRELINFEKNLNSQWSAKMKDLFQRAIELKKKMTEEDYLKPPKEVAQFIEELDQLLTINYEEFHQREQAFVKRMIKHRKSIFSVNKKTHYPFNYQPSCLKSHS